MPVHDWTRLYDGAFHHFHHDWISEIAVALNGGLLPSEYYALAEQVAGDVGPDVLALERQARGDREDEGMEMPEGDGTALLVAPPRVSITAESDREFYRLRKKGVAVRHLSDDRVVAFVEVVSAGNKSSRRAVGAFVEKAAELLEQRIHLLILDLHPPGPRDPDGIHGLIWEEMTGQKYSAPPDKPFTLAAYESGVMLRAYVEPTAAGQRLSDMPLYLEEGAYVLVPLEETYSLAFAKLPRHLRRELGGQ